MLILFNTVLLPQFASLHGSVASQSSMMVDTILLFIRLLPYMFGIVLSLVGIAIVFVLYVLSKAEPGHENELSSLDPDSQILFVYR
ncbi:hypothetical protein GCM10020331_040160 [Ectobacillus funiculus]